MDLENEKEAETEVETPEPDSLRADMEAAIEKVESEFSESVVAGEPVNTEGKGPKAAKPAPKTAAEIEQSAEGAESGPDDTVVKLHPDDAERYPTLNEERVKAAPEGWRPAAREGWEGLPEPVRREIHRRELDIATGMQSSKDARTLADSFKAATDPYMSILAAEGQSDPMAAISGMLKTVSGLRLGSPQQKAERFAGLVQHYGIDLNILDQALAASIKGEVLPDSDPVSAAVEARMKPVEDFMARMQRQGQESQDRQTAGAAADVDTFGETAEFIADVRMDMADLLDMSSNRGRNMSLQEAYDTACSMNPEIRAILAGRTNGQQAQQQAGHVASKIRTAATSPTGGRGGDGSAPKSDGTLRGDLMASIVALEEAG